LTGGTSQAATGGSLYLTTGLGTTKSSGMIALSTSNGGTAGGVSGMIQLMTGLLSCSLFCRFFDSH
jgi:hypothetical protein